MFVVSRGLGQSLIIDDSLTLTLTEIGADRVAFVRAPGSPCDAGEIVVSVHTASQLTPNVDIVYIPFEPDRARLGFHVAGRADIRLPDSEVLKATKRIRPI